MILRPSRGQTLVELTLVLPVLVVCLLLSLHFGILIWTKLQIVSANRAGLMYSVYHPHDEAAILATVRASMPKYVNTDAQYLSISVTGVGTRPAGSDITVRTEYDISQAGSFLPGGQILPSSDKIIAELTSVVCVGEF